jgi:hypothetical protein
MKIPKAARQQFDRLLTAPLKKTNQHKKEIELLQQQLSEHAEAAAVVKTVRELLNRVERKTSPLYVRLLHAVSAYVCEDVDSADWELRAAVVDSVAHSTKNFDLKR